MISITLHGHKSNAPVAEICRLFFGPDFRCQNNRTEIDFPAHYRIESICTHSGVITTMYYGSKQTEKMIVSGTLPAGREIKRQLYRLLSKITGIAYPWGSLTGIRPTTIAAELSDADQMVQLYDVRSDKAVLAVHTALVEQRVLAQSNEKDLFIYIGIPFCPSRCAYCSFVTHENNQLSSMLSDYCSAVLKEMQAMRTHFRNIRAIYFGGGTPMLMGESVLLSFISESMNIMKPEQGIEITFEAGRPDTFTDRKLSILRHAGVNRICVNPQTLSDKTLMEIGRMHTTKQFFDAYEKVKSADFPSINTDLIVGLPGESMEDFIHSMGAILDLSPDGITVHSLCKKRSAQIPQEAFPKKPSDSPADEMMTHASCQLKEHGYHPYYLYKQKNAVAGLENTGFSKKEKECLYNVAMMSDQRSVLAFGAGVSKRLVKPNQIERLDCLRNPKQYIARIEETITKKRLFFEV